MRQPLRLLLAGGLLAAAPAWAGDVKVSFSNGLVTIAATDASPRQILAEWARQGQVRITNLDRLTGGPITLQMTDVPEAQALETILRGTAGYVAAPRAEGVAAASGYDRILLMPGAAPALPLAGSASSTAQNAMAGRGRPQTPPAYDAMADDEMENVRQAVGQARDASRTDPYRQGGQFMMPGIAQPSAGSAVQAPVPPSSGPYGNSQASQPPFNSGNSSNRGPASIGAATPGVFTAQPQARPMEVRQTPYSNDGPPPLPAPAASSSPVPGQVVGQAPVTSGPQPGAGPTGAGGGASSAPFPFQNPYGLPDIIRAPVVNPSANPYGLPAPVKVTPPPATPPAPIKKSGTDGGQGQA